MRMDAGLRYAVHFMYNWSP